MAEESKNEFIKQSKAGKPVTCYEILSEEDVLMLDLAFQHLEFYAG